MLSSAGNGGESASGGGAKGECESALELGVVVVCFLFLKKNEGASQLPGCEEGRGRVSFGVGCCCCCLLSYLGGAGGESASGCVCCLLRGMEASQLPVVFCGEWRRVSSRGGEKEWGRVSSRGAKGNGGESASRGAKGNAGVGCETVAVVVCFFFWGGGGRVSFQGGEGGMM